MNSLPFPGTKIRLRYRLSKTAALDAFRWGSDCGMVSTYHFEKHCLLRRTSWGIWLAFRLFFFFFYGWGNKSIDYPVGEKILPIRPLRSGLKDHLVWMVWHGAGYQNHVVRQLRVFCIQIYRRQKYEPNSGLWSYRTTYMYTINPHFITLQISTNVNKA